MVMRMPWWVWATPAVVRSVPTLKGRSVKIGATISGCVSWNWPQARSSDCRVMKLSVIVVGSGSPTTSSSADMNRLVSAAAEGDMYCHHSRQSGLSVSTAVFAAAATDGGSTSSTV
jgi:hypothetical protein